MNLTPEQWREVEPEIKHAEALRLRAMGLTLAAIASTLGYATPYGASKAIESALKLSRDESAEQLRGVDVERLEIATRSLMSSVEQGDVFAIDRLIKLAGRKAALLGLDMPAKVAMTDPTGQHEYTGLTDADRLARIDAIIDAVRKRRTGQADNDKADAPVDTGSGEPPAVPGV